MSDQPSFASPSPARLLDLTARIVSAHAGHNPITAERLPELIRGVHRALGGLGQKSTPAEPARPEPAVPIRRSVRPDRITCLECGGRFSMLKRHLAADHEMTPESYRARWGLPRDYPMVAPDYAAMRSSLAKQIGLGRKRAGVEAEDAPPSAATPEPAPVGRRPRSGPTAGPAARKPRRRSATQESDRG